MRKALSILSVASVALAGLVSCNVMEEPQFQREQQGSHSAFFDGKVAELMDDSGTKGLSLVAMPDWRKTAADHIHLFENGKEGRDPVMTIDPDDNRIAHFSATFVGEEEDISIVAPTKAGESYVYNGIIAPSDESGAFAVPSVQFPDSEKIAGKPESGVSLIDPDADFLIGRSMQSKIAYSSDDSVNLTFVRPVSLFRLAIINLGEGEKIQEVSFTTDKVLTGKFTKDKVNFEAGTVAFDQAEGSKTVTLKYDNADPKSIFYAYFVICPVEGATVKTIVVKTDKYVYTKEYTDSKPVSFNCNTFYSIAVNMKDVKPSDGDEREAQTLVFDPAETSFEIGGEVKDFVEPVLSGNKTNTITYASSDEDVATVDAQGNVTFLEAGDVVISATAAENEQYKEGTGSYIVHVTKPATQTPAFSAATALYQIGSGDFTAPVLSGAETDVTYASSITEVATVNEITGEVTIIAAGETTITASAEKTAEYFGAEASYVLTVTAAPAPQTKTWYPASAIESGREYIIVSNGKALKNDDGKVAAADVTVSGGSIETSDASLVWTSNAVTDADLLKYGKFQMLSGSKYLSRISGSTSTSKLEIHGASDTELQDKMRCTMWDYDGSCFFNISIYNNNPSSYYAYYSGSWQITTTKNSATIYETRQPQSVSFSEPSASYDLKDGVFDAPELQGIATGATVTYSSSNPAIADVNASTGAVTGKAKGTVTITAIISGTDAYQPAKAEYELTVVNTTPAPAGTKFYKVDKLAAGEEGLIVSNGYAMQNNGGALAAYEVTPSNDEIEISGDVLESVVWKVTDSEDTTYGPYSISNDGKYIYVNKSGSSTYSLGFAGEPTKYVGWDYADGQITNSQSSSSVRYLYCSTNSNAFTVSTSSGDTHKASFYSKTKPEDEPAGTVTYTKVTSAPADWSGTYLFVKESSNVALAYNKTNFNTSVSINNGKIQSDDLEAYQLTVTKSSVVDGMYEVKTTNGKYVYWYSNAFLNDYNTGTRTGSNTYYCSFSLKDGGDVTMYSTRTGSGGSVNYITYQDSKFTFNTTSTNTIQLYRLDGSEGEGKGEGGEDEPVSTTLTFNKVTSLSAGKYLVSTSNSGKHLFCDFSAIKDNVTLKEKSNSSAGNPTVTGTEEDFAGCIVEIEASSSNWLIKYEGKYLKQAGDKNPSTISFVSDKSDASVLTYSDSRLKDGQYNFYYSDSSNGFKFTSDSGHANVQNLVFYMLAD